MADDILNRLGQADWIGKTEPTVCSQLIMPVLMLLGYGEHTLHKVVEQQSYPLSDPWSSKGSRRVKLDYQPRVFEEGLWVMEAKGTNAIVSAQTLGQVRDYAIHPEVRAALMVTVDAAGFLVFDPWDEHWDEPLLTVGVNEVADRIEELRAVLGFDRVGDFVRRRHFDHLRRALSASLEFGVLEDAEREFRELIEEARVTIDSKRKEIHRTAREAAEALHERVLRQSGAWGVAQANNSPWIGRVSEWGDFARAVLMQEEVKRPTQILSVQPAIEAVYRPHVPEGAPLWRPLWWLRVVMLGGCIRLRGESGCEPYATDAAHQAMRDCLLEFADDPLAAAAWRHQRVMIPLQARIIGLAPFEKIAVDARAQLNAEALLRFDPTPSWFFGHAVRLATIRALAGVDPWTVEELDQKTAEAAEMLERFPVPMSEWLGPASDPWLLSWQDFSPLLMCGLAALNDHPGADELITGDSDICAAVAAAAASAHDLLRRPAVPLAARLGLKKALV